MSKIEWTEATWNPVTGCTKISPGCKYCYAERMAGRLQKMGSPRYRHGFYLQLHEDILREPLHWKKGKMIFVCSMSDLFHERVPFDYIDKVMRTIELAPQHTFQILTKRIIRMYEYFLDRPVPENAWIGTSVECRQYAQPRIDYLNSILVRDGGVRFLSCEPLLGGLGQLHLGYVNWIIAGGESGPKARPMDPDWVRSIRDQCQAAGVPFFFKQWGGVNKKRAGRILDGRTWDEMPARLNGGGVE